MVNQRMLGLGTARSVIRELFEYGKIRAAQVGAENVFDFSLGNPSVPCPQEVNDTAVRILREQPEVIHCYTSAQGDQEARQRFADSLNRRFGTCYTADQFYITVGAAASLCCVFNGLTCPGDEFVVFAPYFPEYKVFIEGAGAKMVLIPPEIEGFQIDFDAFEAAISEHTKGVVVNSPNNPSGVVYSRETLERLAAILTEKSRAYGHPIYLISDEPYREIVFSGFQVPWIPQLYPDTIVCYSFSKSLSIPGERVGVLAFHPAMAERDRLFDAIQGTMRVTGYLCVSPLFQLAAAECLGATADVSVYERNRDLICDGLRRLGYRFPEPQGAFYLLLKAPEGDGRAFSRRCMAEDVLVVPGEEFFCPGYVRLAYCVPEERLRRSLPAFRRIAESYGILP